MRTKRQRRTDMVKLKGAFRDYAKAPNINVGLIMNTNTIHTNNDTEISANGITIPSEQVSSVRETC
jgi:hypothetical protein